MANSTNNRTKTIIRTSFFGAGMNLVLVAIKTFVGLFTNSIALILDAVNNLGDAFSSVITIVGTKLSQKKPDRKHPFGYGRIEYFTSLIIGCLILVAGLSSVKEAIIKILHPADTNYSIISVILIGIAIVAKIFTGLFVKATGKRINAKTLEDSGTDALMDAVVSFTTMIAAILNMIFGWKLEGWLGAFISLLVIKSAFEILQDTVSTLLGTRGDQELVQKLKKQIASIENVKGAYDLVLHNYGPSKSIGTIHVEVADNLPASKIHEISRKIQDDVFEEYGIIMTVGIYASNNTEPFAIELRKQISENILTMDHVVGFHGLYINKEKNIINFDVVIDFSAKDMEAVKIAASKKMKELYPQYNFRLQYDMLYNSYK